MANRFDEQVAAGAAWLDRNYPGWWEESKIDLDTLLLSECKRCVAGQLYGMAAARDGLEDGWDYFLEIFTADVGSLGFNLPYNVEESLAAYAELTQAWKDLITARRSAEMVDPDDDDEDEDDDDLDDLYTGVGGEGLSEREVALVPGR